jgi:hypothetical protein
VDCKDSIFGGDEPPEYCLTSCNRQTGLTLAGAACLQNRVENCSSGLDRSGTECRGNGEDGFACRFGASENVFEDCESGCNGGNGYYFNDLNTRANALRNCTAGTD